MKYAYKSIGFSDRRSAETPEQKHSVALVLSKKTLALHSVYLKVRTNMAFPESSSVVTSFSRNVQIRS